SPIWRLPAGPTPGTPCDGRLPRNPTRCGSFPTSAASGSAGPTSDPALGRATGCHRLARAGTIPHRGRLDMPDLTDRTWLWMAAACYGAGFVLGTIGVLRERRHSPGLMYAIIGIGYLLQTIGLYVRGRAVGGCPLGNAFELFQFTGWSATTLYLVVGATFR